MGGRREGWDGGETAGWIFSPSAGWEVVALHFLGLADSRAILGIEVSTRSGGQSLCPPELAPHTLWFTRKPSDAGTMPGFLNIWGVNKEDSRNQGPLSSTGREDLGAGLCLAGPGALSWGPVPPPQASPSGPAFALWPGPRVLSPARPAPYTRAPDPSALGLSAPQQEEADRKRRRRPGTGSGRTGHASGGHTGSNA